MSKNAVQTEIQTLTNIYQTLSGIEEFLNKGSDQKTLICYIAEAKRDIESAISNLYNYSEAIYDTYEPRQSGHSESF
ncbi:MAG: hypothetical protein F6K21_16680 [Symploca sp. SIO2D2]|nr:hypothetical protein [Symploca sp. SIO2D2]